MIRIVTIVLDGMPWIACHLPVFNKLRCDWRWDIAEGVSKPTGCTSWCKPIPGRLSLDGTTQYLDSISSHPRIHIHRKNEWDGKLEMVNACCDGIENDTIVLQVDSDEIWTARQIEAIIRLFTSGSDNNAMLFRCRYFVGKDIVVTGKDCYGNHKAYEWRRAWMAKKGFKFTKHEAPEVNQPVKWFNQDTTETIGIVFDHYAYATEAQVRFKENYYGYAGAVEHWNRLQRNTQWPIKLGQFLPWVKDNSEVIKISQQRI